MKNDCSIIISSCDAFEDVWKPFSTLFFKYWPDCPFPIYLITNYKKYDDPRVTTIAVGEDKKWASNMRKALGSITTPYILYLQEDYLLEKKVDTEKVLRFLRYLKEYSAAYVRLSPMPKPDILYPPGDIGDINQDAPYRTSLQAAFWDKNALFSLLKDGESGWDFEMKGTKRSQEIKQLFLCSTKMVIPYFKMTAIKKGRWYYDAVKLCEQEGITLDLSKRKVESRSEYYKRKMKMGGASFKSRKFGRLLSKQDFNPTFLGLITPAYFARKGMYNFISYFSPRLEGKTLDIGCGTKPYRSFFKDYIGIDVPDYDGRHFPFKDNEFDSALSTEVLQYVLNPDEFMAEIRRVLKPDGLMLITVPNRDTNPSDPMEYSHDELASLFEKHGFAIVDSQRNLNDVRSYFQALDYVVWRRLAKIKNKRFKFFTYTLVFGAINTLGTIAYVIFPFRIHKYMQHMMLIRKTAV